VLPAVSFPSSGCSLTKQELEDGKLFSDAVQLLDDDDVFSPLHEKLKPAGQEVPVVTHRADKQ
jgi:hypothetical protein